MDYKKIEDEVVENDLQWEDDLEKIQAEGLGLTVEEFRQFQLIEDEEELDKFMKEHSRA